MEAYQSEVNKLFEKIDKYTPKANNLDNGVYYQHKKLPGNLIGLSRIPTLELLRSFNSDFEIMPTWFQFPALAFLRDLPTTQIYPVTTQFGRLGNLTVDRTGNCFSILNRFFINDRGQALRHEQFKRLWFNANDKDELAVAEWIYCNTRIGQLQISDVVLSNECSRMVIPDPEDFELMGSLLNQLDNGLYVVY